MPLIVERVAEPGEAVRAAIASPLREYNVAMRGIAYNPPTSFGLLLRAHAGGPVQGGLTAGIQNDWMYVDLLFVALEHRGQGWGTVLMRRAEDEARFAGCRGVWVDTYSFQAPGFYERMGFAKFGQIDGYPPPHARLFYSKVLL